MQITSLTEYVVDIINSQNQEEIKEFFDFALHSFVSSIEGSTGKVNCFVIPEPEKIPLQADGIWVYIRYEKTPSDS